MSFLRRFFANAEFWNGLLVVLPSLVGFIGGKVIALLIDRRLSRLRGENTQTKTEMAILDVATRDFELRELLRASFLLDMHAGGGDGDTAFQLDQLHRQMAIGLLRNIVSTLDPGSWAGRMGDYAATVATDYRVDDFAGKKRLQEFENATIAEAKARLTVLQERYNGERDRIERLEARKTWWTNVLGYLGNLASVVAFLAKYVKLAAA